MSSCDKIRLLLVSANPITTSPLSLEQEKRDIEEALRYSPYRDSFAIEMLHAVRITDFRRAFADSQRTPNILHFCGHGDGESGLVFEDQDGLHKFVRGNDLADFLSLFTESLDCVVLNACYSEVQAKEIHKYVNCVIGMKESIGDKSAIVFASAFYEALFAGRSYQFAYDFANKAIALDDDISKIESILLLRNNTSPFSSINISMGQEENNNRQIGSVCSEMSLTQHLNKHDYTAQLNNVFGISPDLFSLCGRKQDMAHFMELCCENSETLSHVELIVVTGESGIGKSRFIYEVSKRLPQEQWDSFWLPVHFFIGESETWDTIKDWSFSKNILFVVDNISLVAEKVSFWLQGLIRNKTVTQKIVVVLVERSGFKNDGNSKFISTLTGEPEWIRLMRYNDFDFIFDSIGLKIENRTIHLDMLNQSDLSDICLEYAKYYTCRISQLEINEILRKLELIDKYKRPLFLLFILEAWRNEERWNQWNLENLLRYIRNSEDRRLLVRFASHNDLYDRACNLMLLADIFGQIDLTDQKLKETKYFRKYCCCADDREYETILEQLKLLGYYKKGTLYNKKPALVREFNVLCVCMQKGADDDFVATLMSSLWQYAPVHINFFLLFTIGDYYESNVKSEFKDLFESEHGLLCKPELSQELLAFYLIPFTLYMGRNKSFEPNKVFEEMKELIYKNCEETFADMLWGNTLLTVTIRRRDMQTRLFAIDELRMLVKKKPDDDYYAGALIEVLLQSTITADVERHKEYISEIKTLIQGNEQEQFIVQYAGALQNLIVKLSVTDAEIYIDEICELYEKNPCEGLKIKYCRALHNYYIIQMLQAHEREGYNHAENTFNKLKSLTGSCASTEMLFLCYHCAYIKFIFNKSLIQKMDEQEIEWAKNVFILFVNDKAAFLYLHGGTVSYSAQKVIGVNETIKNPNSQILQFFVVAVKNFTNSPGVYGNTMYKVLKFTMDTTRNMPYYFYPFFLSLIELAIELDDINVFPDRRRHLIIALKDLFMELVEYGINAECEIMACCMLMYTWNYYSEPEQYSIMLFFDRTYRNNMDDMEIANIYAQVLRMGCGAVDMDFRKKSYDNFKSLAEENISNEIVICQFFDACNTIFLDEKSEFPQEEMISKMCEIVCDAQMISKKSLDTFSVALLRSDICIGRWLPELSRKLQQIGSSDLTVILITLQIILAMDREDTVEWAQDIIDNIYDYAEKETVRNSVYEIISILSGEKESDIEAVLSLFFESITDAIASYSYMDLTYDVKMKFSDGIIDSDRIQKNLDYLRKALNIQKK